MQPRPIDYSRDLPALAQLLGRTRANGGLSHPGGIQWWLREAGDRDDFDAFVWTDDDSELVGFALIDGSFLVSERDQTGPTQLEQLDWTEVHLRNAGWPALETRVAGDDPAVPEIEGRGYVRKGLEYELMAHVKHEPKRVPLPAGFRFASLEDVSDDKFIEGHVAAWSDKRPSPYRRELHEAVKSSPQFRPDLVTIALAPDGTVASYCIGWMDEQSETLEIEPLGTHRDYRRLGLAHAVVKEVQHRAWADGAKHVLVWNEPAVNAPAYGLYTGADMSPSRALVELTKQL
jgi:GNAT superfamily N-acetyltransferase